MPAGEQGNCLWVLYRRGMGFQPMNHRQDADATKSHGQDARATSVRNAHMQLPCAGEPRAGSLPHGSPRHNSADAGSAGGGDGKGRPLGRCRRPQRAKLPPRSGGIGLPGTTPPYACRTQHSSTWHIANTFGRTTRFNCLFSVVHPCQDSTQGFWSGGPEAKRTGARVRGTQAPIRVRVSTNAVESIIYDLRFTIFPC